MTLRGLVSSVAFVSRFRFLLGDGRSEGREHKPLKPKSLGIHHSCGVEMHPSMEIQGRQESRTELGWLTHLVALETDRKKTEVLRLCRVTVS